MIEYSLTGNQLKVSNSFFKMLVILSSCRQYQMHLFCVIWIYFPFFEWDQDSRLRIELEVKWEHNRLFSYGVKNLFFLCRNLYLELILLITFRDINSSVIFSSNMQTKFVAFEFCSICIFLYVMFSFGTFLCLLSEAKVTDIVLFSPKWIISLLSTNYSQMSVKSPFTCS